MLGRVIDRARAVPGNCTVVVATSERAVDDAIADFAVAENVPVFRGATDDVAGRALACMRAFNMDRFVRISGDSPFFDTALVREFIDLHLERDVDLVTNIAERTYPPGSSVEVVSSNAMVRLIAATDDVLDREHVTRYFYNHSDEFDIHNVRAPDGRFAGIRLVVDTPEDLARAEWLATEAEGRTDVVPMESFASLAAKWDATAHFR